MSPDVLAVYRLIHRTGCGGLAFFIESFLQIGASRPGARIVMTNGDRPKPDEHLTCSACGRRMGRDSLQFENIEQIAEGGGVGTRH